ALPSEALVTITDNPATEVDESQIATGRQRKKNTWTFLLVAKDQVSGNTDTIMVCTYDTENQQIGLVSIPRDTFVIREGYRYRRINAAYANGGMEELKGAVSQTLGIPIDHHILIDTKIFVELIDAVGGIDFDVPVHMAYDDPYQDLHIHYEPGLQHLTGQQALEVVRCRKNSDGAGGKIYDAYPDADIGRTRTQQALLTAVAKKVIANPLKIRSYLEIFFQYVDTSLTFNNLLWLAQPALKFNFDNLTTVTLPGNGNASYGGYTYLYALYIDQTLEIVNNYLNPYTTPITREMVYIPQGN
ncbi:MAG: LCP family protein, partial [Oscillospiraceae bacterium]|nr:LCP family protein [Oscillospiraceae bacterium]